MTKEYTLISLLESLKENYFKYLGTQECVTLRKFFGMLRSGMEIVIKNIMSQEKQACSETLQLPSESYLANMN